jgi:hypothetical protein
MLEPIPQLTDSHPHPYLLWYTNSPAQVYPSRPGRAFFETDGPGSWQKAEVMDAFTSAERFHQIVHPVLEGSRAQIQHPYATPEVLEAKLGPMAPSAAIARPRSAWS